MADIEELLAAKKWPAARKRIQEDLLTSPSDHWLWMHLGLTYYEEFDYEKALACSKRSVELEPSCPLALWHYAGSLSMAGKESAAIAIWTILLETDLEEIAFGECGEGMDWAMQLVNDVHYRVGRFFERKGQTTLARASYEKYLHNREHGVGSIYDAASVRKHLSRLVTVSA